LLKRVNKLEGFTMKVKLSKEEKAAKLERREKLKELMGGRKDLQGVNDLVTELRKEIIEAMYDEELKLHLGFSKSEARPESSDNYRNGSYAKTVKSSVGEIELTVPRDRNGEFEPQIVKKYQTDIFGIEDKIIALYGCGMSTRDISENIRELYGFDVSAEVVSNVTNRVLIEVKEWQSRSLKSVYSVIFMDGIVFKVKKDGVIQKCTAYGCVGIDMEGQKEVLSMHIGGCESAKYWLSVMNDLKARGVQDVLIFCTDNLKGLDDAIKSCYPNSDHQKCIVHQIRNSVKHVSYKELKEVCADLKRIYTAPTAEAGKLELEAFSDKWDKKYGYISRSWSANWEQLSTFWTYPNEIRRLIYTTNPIESFNRCIRKVTKNKPTFPSEDALMKSIFLGIRRLEKKWTTKVHNWGIIYSQLMILFSERLNKMAA
jgi:transposase-like protein